ncbi:MAG: hypothetical protein JXA24_03455, partial [Proteobacteria bacterium]|nr:hypothetical protein [Pseudomonadota bacterium]
MAKAKGLDGIKPITDLTIGKCRFEVEGDLYVPDRVMKTCPAGMQETPAVYEYKALIEEQEKLIKFFKDNRDALAGSISPKLFEAITADAPADILKNKTKREPLTLLAEYYLSIYSSDKSPKKGVAHHDVEYKIHFSSHPGFRGHEVEFTDKGGDGVFDSIRVYNMRQEEISLDGEQFHPLIVGLV